MCTYDIKFYVMYTLAAIFTIFFAIFLGGFSHLRCMFTNPGAVPKDAMPLPQI